MLKWYCDMHNKIMHSAKQVQQHREFFKCHTGIRKEMFYGQHRKDGLTKNPN